MVIVELIKRFRPFICPGARILCWSTIPGWLLGALLTYVGVRHAMLAMESLRRPALTVSVIGMGIVSLWTGNLLLALAAEQRM